MGAVVSKVKVLSIAVRQVLEISASYERLQKRIQEDPGLPVPNPTRSFWHDVLSPIARHVPETLPVYVDVVVIGSGITGASTARTLLREGPDNLKVLMIEARDACSGATGRNGGHVKPPLHHDYLLLKKRLGPEQAAKLIRLRLMHLREMLAVASEDDILSESQCREVDSLDVYFAQEDFDEAKKQLQVWKKDMPEESKDYIALDSRESIEKFHLSPSVVGVVSNSAGAMHPYRFVTSILLRLLKQYPDRFFFSTNTPCIEIKEASSSSPFYKVVTSRGVVLTKHIMHATNALASHLLKPMRSKIFSVRGNMTAQRPGTTLSPSSLDGRRSWVFYDRHIGYDYLTQLPEGEQELMFGGGFVQAGEDGLGEIGCTDDSKFNSGVAAHLAGALPIIFGGQNWGEESDKIDAESGEHWFDGRVKAMWSGIIGISADCIPWVGRIPQKLTGRNAQSIPQSVADNVYSNTLEKEKVSFDPANTAAPGEWIAAGYSGEGMAHAFLCGRAVAFQILDKAQEITGWLPECLGVTEERWSKAHAEDLIEELWG